MTTRRSNIPLLLLFLYPWAHLYAIGESLPEDQKSGYWTIGATVYFLLDALLAGALAYLLYARMPWTKRERKLIALAAFPVLFGVIFAGLNASGPALRTVLAMNGVPLAVILLGWFWTSRQRDMRDM